MMIMKMTPMTAEEFDIKLRELLVGKTFDKESVDFPFLHTTINTLLEILADFHRENIPLEEYTIDVDFYLALRALKGLYPMDIEEARYILFTNIQLYFSNKDSFRYRGYHLNKVNRELKES